MKILCFSPPFNGHFAVLKKLQESYPQFNYKTVYTSWTNLKVTGEDNLSKGELNESLPAMWTFPRVADLLDDAIKCAQEFKPDIIIYDYFSLEGYFVGKSLNIPTWCSIPLLMGPNNNQKQIDEVLKDPLNIRAIDQIQTKVNFDINSLECLSDALHLPGDKNIVWSYADLTPSNYLENRRGTESYHFVGNENKKISRKKNGIYLSFGTVVMGNLWEKKLEISQGMPEFIKGLTERIESEKVLFATQGRKILDQYPSNWEVHDYVNQVEVIASAKAFITHGGNNSYHEAVLQQTPMIVIPFFGDQLLVAKTVQERNLGINLSTHQELDVRVENHFLNDQLAERVAISLKKIENTNYQSHFENLNLNTPSICKLLEASI